MNNSLDDYAHEMLYEVLAKIDNPGDMKLFLDDLCTINEVKQMAQRIQCAVLMLKGNTYNQIIEKTDISSATLSRVSKCLQYGSGGYSDILASVISKQKPEEKT
jgi:TrpR-related protein YerC/YecD